MSETTVPARLGSLKDVIGPGIVFVPNAPRSSTAHYLGQFAAHLKRHAHLNCAIVAFFALLAGNAGTHLNP
jgi:hypothetical protein